MLSLNQIMFEKKEILSWNRTFKSKANVFYPKNLKEIKKFIKKTKLENYNYIIKTGECSYDSKSINPNFKTHVLSLKNFHKILNINLKKKFIIVQTGALISNIVYELKNKGFTIFSIPGGQKITLGGAISANVIGKDSSSSAAAFGDAVMELLVLATDGSTKKIRERQNIRKYIGAFGMSGLILQAKLRIKKIKSQNLIVKTNMLQNLNDVKKNLDSLNDYNYIQIDPFFRKSNFAIAFSANFLKEKNNIYKAINFRSFFIEKFFFILSSYFINRFTWRFFYKLFFLINKKKMYKLDLHNYHYGSKYKHMVPLIAKQGLIEYEILIKEKFILRINSIFNFLKKKHVFPMYIVLKKVYKSKNTYSYSFNDNGYALAISIDGKYIKNNIEKKLLDFLNKNNLKLNLSKTDSKLVGSFDKKNSLFMSCYKKKISEYNKFDKKNNYRF